MLTAFLVRRTGAGVVVRYNGGAQAGHNVVTPDGRHHTFAQFGSGSFVAGVQTFLSRHVVIHPTALLAEAAALREKGVSDALSRLRISEGALVITPFHQAAGRLRELARGDGRHGSCGVGVGEAVGDAREDLLDRWLAEAARLAAMGSIAPDSILADWLAGADSAVFEGAQGVLLDEWAGFHPYTTWSRCTLENALGLLAEAAPGAEVRRIGVLRSHAVRHGPGPLPTETPELRSAVREHNVSGEWAGDRPLRLVRRSARPLCPGSGGPSGRAGADPSGRPGPDGRLADLRQVSDPQTRAPWTGCPCPGSAASTARPG